MSITVANRANTDRIKELLTVWYRQQAQRIFPERLNVCLAQVKFLKLTESELTIRHMQTRWGSCTPAGRVMLNLKLIQACSSSK